MWIANLSDGTVVTEQEPIPGEPTSWRKLLSRCKNEGIKITGLRCGLGNALVTALPYKQCEGYFHAYEVLKTLFGSQPDRKKQGIGSIVGDKVFITWMEMGDNDLTYISQEVRPLDMCKIGSTLE